MRKRDELLYRYAPAQRSSWKRPRRHSGAYIMKQVWEFVELMGNAYKRHGIFDDWGFGNLEHGFSDFFFAPLRYHSRLLDFLMSTWAWSWSVSRLDGPFDKLFRILYHFIAISSNTLRSLILNVTCHPHVGACRCWVHTKGLRMNITESRSLQFFFIVFVILIHRKIFLGEGRQ